MAKYDVKHTCGHTHEYQLFGKNSERDRKLEWLATQECPECRKAREAAEKMEEIKGTVFESVVNVELTGSEKQKRWARDIRLAIALDGVRIEKIYKDKLEGAKRERQLACLPAIAKFMASKTESKFWIEKPREDGRLITEIYSIEGYLITSFFKLFKAEIAPLLEA